VDPQTHIKSFAEMVELVRETNPNHKVNDIAQSVEFLVGPADQGNVMMLRWEKSLPFVQVILPLLKDIPASRFAEVNAALAYVNNAAVVPGLGFDQTNNLVYYRLTAPLLADGIRADMLRGYVQVCLRAAIDVIGAVRKVVEGASVNEAFGQPGGQTH
jgi:hypothetical protein